MGGVWGVIGGTRNPYEISITKPESRNNCGDLYN